MPFEIFHFRGSDEIITDKGLIDDTNITFQYLDDVLTGSIYKRELLRVALEEMDWRKNLHSLRFLPGRRYELKGFKSRVAMEANFSCYEYLLPGLFRMQVAFDHGLIDVGMLLLTAERGIKSPYGTTAELVEKEMAELYPTISLPVAIVLFTLGKPSIPQETNDTNDNTQPVEKEAA
jgi:hypothetical protein